MWVLLPKIDLFLLPKKSNFFIFFLSNFLQEIIKLHFFEVKYPLVSLLLKKLLIMFELTNYFFLYSKTLRSQTASFYYIINTIQIVFNLYYNLVFLAIFVLGCTGIYKEAPFCYDILSSEYYTVKVFISMLFYLLYGPIMICTYSEVFYKVKFFIFFDFLDSPKIIDREQQG